MGLEELIYLALKDNILKFLLNRLDWLRIYYERAGFKRPFRIYVSNLVFVLAVTYAVSSMPFAVLFVTLGIPLPASIALTLIAAVIPTSLLGAALIYYPVYASKIRGDKIDAAAPYIVAYLGILASAGHSPEEIIERYAEVSDMFGAGEEFKRLIKRVVYGSMDLSSALREAARDSPSHLLSEVFEGFASISETGGNTRNFFRYAVERIIKSREARLKDILNSLSVIAEIYISLVVVAPLVFTILLMIMASLGGMPISPYLIIGVINLVVVPALAMGLVVMIDGLLSRV